jgi:hypothetical protein
MRRFNMSVAAATVVSSAKSGCLCSKRRARCVFEKQLEKACGLRSMARHGDTKIDASCHASARRAIAVNYIPQIDRDRPARVGNSARRNQRGQTRFNAQARISRRDAFDPRLPITIFAPAH